MTTTIPTPLSPGGGQSRPGTESGPLPVVSPEARTAGVINLMLSFARSPRDRFDAAIEAGQGKQQIKAGF